jgi:hypothetical protein
MVYYKYQKQYLFSFLLFSPIASSSFAQTNNNEEKPINPCLEYYGNSTKPYFFDGKNSIMREGDEKIKGINCQNNYQVQQVIKNNDFDIWEKWDILNNLETLRTQKVNSVYKM